MCGIAGLVRGKNAAAVDRSVLERMSWLVRSRGPDDDGVWTSDDGRAGLAHRRLSIIDLSPAGHQPMLSPDGRTVIVFNGEIYNFRELRAAIDARHAWQWRGHSDTEVLLALYVLEGDAAFERLNGIFALAIWDDTRHQLLLARDGMGVKPLYYARTADQSLAFASELKAILEAPNLDRQLDPVAVTGYLELLYSPGSHTMLQSVKKLLPGHTLRFDPATGEETIRCFYKLPFDQQIEPMSAAEAEEGVRHYLGQAVRRQMVADVTVGTLLSGGLDSSSIAFYGKQHVPAGGTLPCFSIELASQGRSFLAEGFEDDLAYAKQMAAALDLPLHVVPIEQQVLMDIDRMVYTLDEPEGDPSALNTYFICQRAREQGVKVLLSGLGGDDIFTGYRRHRALMLERYWAWLPQRVRGGLKRLAGNLPVGHPWARRLGKALQHADGDADQRLTGYFSWTENSWIRRLLHPDFLASLNGRSGTDGLRESLALLPPDTPPLNRMLYLDCKHFLTDHNLNYTDKMGMAVGVEVRVPFLDPDLMAFAARLPLRFKQHGRTGKWIFRQAMRPHLPREVIWRTKTGFGVPLRSWLHCELQPKFQAAIHSGALEKHGVFSAKGVEAVLRADREKRVDAAYTLLTVLCIESWCRQFLK